MPFYNRAATTLHFDIILTRICLMAGVPTEMTLNTTSTVKLCQSIIVMTSQRDNTMRHDNALPVTYHSRCASHRTMHMSYRCKTYTWNDVILVKRSMIRGFLITNSVRIAQKYPASQSCTSENHSLTEIPRFSKLYL